MDSTHAHAPLPLKSSPSKLPIKRKGKGKTKTLPSSFFSPIPNPNFPPSSSSSSSSALVGPTPPPFKFHRIWTQSDEIRFLQGLLHSASDGLVFPRDLPLFYNRFSHTMSQPYSNSQLSEKLRRLKNKFRVISYRLARGLDVSTHDRALYDLSKKLWSSEFSAVSPFVCNPSQGIANSSQNERCEPHRTNVDHKVGEGREDVHGDGKLEKVAARAVVDVFDQCVREARMSLVLQGMHKFTQAMSISSKDAKMVDFVKRWEEQKALELDLFARRLRLKLENALHQN